jgi:hypothetical protein
LREGETNMNTTSRRSWRYSKAIILTTLSVFLLSNAIVSTASAQEFNYITWQPGTTPPTTSTGDCTNHGIPVVSFPSNKWSSYADPLFNTTIRRFTDWANEHGSRSQNIQYTTFSVGNSNNTMVAFGNGTHSNLFYNATTGAFLRADDHMYYSQYNYVGDDEFRWSHDPSKPNIGYFRDKWYFCEYDYSKPQGSRVTLIRDFSIDYPNSTSIDNNDK